MTDATATTADPWVAFAKTFAEGAAVLQAALVAPTPVVEAPVLVQAPAKPVVMAPVITPPTPAEQVMIDAAVKAALAAVTK